MANNWSSVYPSRIYWANKGKGNTPVDEKNLNKSDIALKELDNRVLKLGYSEEYTINPNDWQTISSGGYYSYKYFISSTKYSDDSAPFAKISAVSKEETEEEHQSVNYVGKVWCDSNGITLYATSKPTTTLKLLIQGY